MPTVEEGTNLFYVCGPLRARGSCGQFREGGVPKVFSRKDPHPVVPDGLGDAVLLLPSHIGTTSGNASVQGLNEPVK